MKRGGNWPLRAGLGIVGLLLVVGAFYPLLFRYPGADEPAGAGRVVVLSGEAGVEIKSAPFPPSLAHPLGTDEWGRDLLGRLLYGTRLTLTAALLTGALRMLLAIPLGLWAGARQGWVRWLLDQSVAATSAIPAVLLIIFLTRPLAWYHQLPPLQSAGMLMFLVALVGVPRAAVAVGRRAEEVLAQPFIAGALAAGAGPFRTIYRHVLPHLMPVFLLQGAAEVAAALWLFGQLGVAHVFLGGTRIKFDDVFGWFRSDLLGEWSGILAQGRTYTRAAPWMLLGPAFFFALAASGFHLVAEGLRRRYEQRWGGGYVG